MDRSPKPRSRSSPREDLRLAVDEALESVRRRPLLELEELRTSEDERLPPMRALNMVGRESDHHVGWDLKPDENWDDARADGG